MCSTLSAWRSANTPLTQFLAYQSPPIRVNYALFLACAIYPLGLDRILHQFKHPFTLNCEKTGFASTHHYMKSNFTRLITTGEAFCTTGTRHLTITRPLYARTRLFYCIKPGLHHNLFLPGNRSQLLYCGLYVPWARYCTACGQQNILR